MRRAICVGKDGVRDYGKLIGHRDAQDSAGNVCGGEVGELRAVAGESGGNDHSIAEHNRVGLGGGIAKIQNRRMQRAVIHDRQSIGVVGDGQGRVGGITFVQQHQAGSGDVPAVVNRRQCQIRGIQNLEN